MVGNLISFTRNKGYIEFTHPSDGKKDSIVDDKNIVEIRKGANRTIVIKFNNGREDQICHIR